MIMDDRQDALDLEAFETLEYLERQCRLTYEEVALDLEVLDDVDFKERYRFRKSTVEAIIKMLNPKFEHENQRLGVMSTAEKVCSALRFLAEGWFQTKIGAIGQISQPSASRAINSVAKCLAEMSRDVITVPGLMEREEISQTFYESCGFPGIFGILDSTYVPILSPGGLESYRCRNGFFSLNVQTLSDHRLRIRNIVVRWPGGTPDSTIFDNSRLKATLESEQVPNKFHVLGDSGYPLRHYLLTPFLSPGNLAETRYNNAHTLARNSVERQYGVWKTRFACLSQKLRGSHSNSQTIIVATAVLHNIAIDLGDCYELGCEPDSPELSTIPDTAAGIAKRNDIVQNFFQ